VNDGRSFYDGPVVSWLRRLKAPVRGLFALACGVIAGLGFAPVGWWPCVFAGVAGLTILVACARRLRGSLGVGLAFGVGLTGVTLNWMSAIFVEAMLGLIGAVSLFYVALAAVLRLALRWRWWPLVAAGCWSALEFTICRWPFDGFGWVRLGYAMIDSPLAWGYPLIGLAGVSFLSALVGQMVAWAVLVPHPLAKRLTVAVGTALGCTALAACGFLVPAASAVVNGGQAQKVVVGWVQGGAPGGGIYGLGPARTITTAQTDETQQLAAKVADGTQPQPDFYVWPEEGTDLDPATDPQTKALVEQALAATGRPIFLGTILDGPGADERQTASLWWDPVKGVEATYIKRGIVPFGEWVPYRDVLLPLFPVLSYVGPQSVPGTTPGVLPVTLSDGRPLRLGVLVCYDVAFDSYAYDLERDGAQVIVVQSSNAMYQGTGQIDQQFAMTRVRAAELRRDILVVTTSGVSGFINADGSVAFQVDNPAPASGVVTMPLQTGTTPAVWLAGWLELGIVIATGACLVLVVVLVVRRGGVAALLRPGTMENALEKERVDA